MVTPAVIRALELLRALNASGSYPNLAEVDRFARADPPRERYLGLSRLAVYALGRGFAEGEIGRYLVDAGLARRHGSTDGVEISAIGLGVLAAEDAGDHDTAGRFDASAPVEVVGRLTDAVVYAKLLIEINKLNEALLVDPYLLPSDLLQIVRLGNVKKVLTTDQSAGGISRAKRKGQLAIALGAAAESAELRFSATDKTELHDRVVLPISGQGIMIGTSLGGTQVTVITHLSEDNTVLLRKHYLPIFQAGENLDPVVRAPLAELDDGATILAK